MRYFIIGGAGFIGSHLTKHLLSIQSEESEIAIFDNFSSGKEKHLEQVLSDSRLFIIRGDIKDYELLESSMKGFDVVYHFAANPDISKAVSQPDIDFWEGTYLTNNVLEAMRKNNVKRLIYTSGSGVYGEVGATPVRENYPDMKPISTYGASKLACEALICSYCHMFSMNAAAFRFANVVGPNQTHGVGYDFVLRLLKDNTKLSILGDGTQDKSYIYVDDVISAMRIVETKHLKGFNSYNVGTLDSITVTEIARLVVEILGLADVRFKYSGGDRGWKGDVPVIKLDSSKIRNFGWANNDTSREAMYKSISSMYKDALQNRFV